MEKVKNHFFSDLSIMLGRSLRHILRSMDTIITVTITPVALMLLFVYVFGGAMAGNMSTAEYTTYMMPGILLISIASGIGYTAIRLYADIQSGIFDRFHSMPISSSATLWGHVFTSLVSNLLSLIVIVIVGFLMGFRTSAGFLEWLVILGILVLFTLSLTWIAVIAGLKAKSVDGAGAFSYPLVFLPFISSAFVPTDSMPTTVRIFAENQPVTAIVNSVRGLFACQPIGQEIWIALSWCIVILIIAYFFAIKAYKQKVIKR